VNRFSAIDEPVDLETLLDAQNLSDLLASVQQLHKVGIRILSQTGAVIIERGDLEGELHRKPLEYSGEVLGAVLVCGPTEEAVAVAAHLATVLQINVETAYARHLTTAIHEAAMEESFTELADRNQRLAAAVERLQELDRLKSNFLATISHELRTPLTSVIGYSEMMLEGLAGELNDEQRDYMETILGKADHLLQLITGILDVSLIESRSLKLAVKPIEIIELIRGVADGLSRDAERREIEVEVPGDHMPRVLADQRKLRQVVLHLLANAIKFSPDGGKVKVELSIGALSPGDDSSAVSPFWKDSLGERFGLRVSVTDSGIGIPSEKLGSIFEPFFQVDQSSTRAFGGTGLGLSLAKSYVEAHGGFLWVNSAPGAGSTFTFSLPVVRAELESHVSGTPLAGTPPG
jgi:signal transduction histidine kinase